MVWQMALAVAVGFLAPPEERREIIAKELEQLQGTWRLVASERDGQVEKIQALNQQLITIKERSFSVPGAQVVKFRIDPLESPKTIDFYHQYTVPGIYELNGDNLKICICANTGERPNDFTTGPLSKRRIMVMVREKQPEPEKKK
jgi:uncharacterized protein (TIGR03067 family)